MVALESFGTGMHFHMFVQIGFLCKTEPAPLMLTLVGLLVGMDSQVVEEIVPFSKIFRTVPFLTLEDLDASFRFRVFEGIDLKILSVGYVFLDFDRSQIEGLPSVHLHFEVGRNLTESLAIFDIPGRDLKFASFLIFNGKIFCFFHFMLLAEIK